MNIRVHDIRTIEIIIFVGGVIAVYGIGMGIGGYYLGEHVVNYLGVEPDKKWWIIIPFAAIPVICSNCVGIGLGIRWI